MPILFLLFNIACLDIKLSNILRHRKICPRMPREQLKLMERTCQLREAEEYKDTIASLLAQNQYLEQSNIMLEQRNETFQVSCIKDMTFCLRISLTEI